MIPCPDCANRITLPPPQEILPVDDDDQQSCLGQLLRDHSTWLNEARLFLDWMHLYQPEGALLDVGSGTGALLEAACAQGRDAYGVEPSDVGFRQCSRLHVPVFHGDLDQALEAYGDFRFDSIVLFRSLSRFSQPVEVLTRCRQLLSRRGRVFIELPNSDSAEARRLGDAWPQARLDQHHVHFTEPGLRHALELVGLRVETSLTFSGRVYGDPHSWKRRKNQSLLAGDDWPSLDWIRVVASLAPAVG